MSGRVVVIIQARMTSQRLAGKVLLPLEGRPVLAHVMSRASKIAGVDGVCLAIPEGPAHEPIAALAASIGGVDVVRGSENDVLARYAAAIDATGADLVVRITADCPFLDPALVAALVGIARVTGAPYVRNSFESGLPFGLDAEVVQSAALRIAHREAADPYEREHVTPFLWRRPERFPCLMVDRRPDRRHWRLVIDTAEDYAFAQAVYRELYPANPLFGFGAIEALIGRRPELLAINGSVAQKEYAGRPDAKRG
jgi:spore coat polysaccharide biosynthesis protein SpsF